MEHHRDTETDLDPDAEFGGTEARKNLEKGLLLKLDARMSILVVICILNYVSCTQIDFEGARILTPRRLIGTMQREWRSAQLESSVTTLIPSAARLRGFEEDLGLTGNQFATVLSILHVGYITMQVPSYDSR